MGNRADARKSPSRLDFADDRAECIMVRGLVRLSMGE
jgi:hypothetical protein